jgi:hypothetical protein
VSEDRDLIDLFFELEDPLEHEALLGRICAIETELVADFLRALLMEEQDEVLRLIAAAELARRGDAEGASFLDGWLEDGDADEFATAIEVLVDLRGPAMFPRLLALWRGGTLDGEQTREVMLAMLAADPHPALTAFVERIEAMHSPDAVRDEEVEAAAIAFARQDYAPGQAALRALSVRARAWPMDEDEAFEIHDLLQRVLAVL